MRAESWVNSKRRHFPDAAVLAPANASAMIKMYLIQLLEPTSADLRLETVAKAEDTAP